MSSSSGSGSSSSGIDKDVKSVTTDARGERLTVIRKTNEEVLRKQLQLEGNDE